MTKIKKTIKAVKSVKPVKAIKTIKTDKRTKTIPAHKPETVLVMRHSGPDGASHNGFIWPESGPVQCPDWKPTNDCGHGLHGWLWGCGDGVVSNFWGVAGARWLVVEVVKADLVDLGGKVKFPRGTVVHCGDQASATKYVADHLPADLIGKVRILGGTATAGDRGTATAGDSGTATAGDSGTATAGYSGTATAGDSGTATAGYSGTATAGDSGTATAGDRGTATAGDSGTATAGDRGTATAGDSGTATAGYRGTATAGDSGTATAGYRGTATAGYRGTATAGDSGTATAGDSGTATAGDSGTVKGRNGSLLAIKYWDGNNRQIATGIVRDGECKPETLYHQENGKLVEGDTAEAKQAREVADRISAMKAGDRL